MNKTSGALGQQNGCTVSLNNVRMSLTATTNVFSTDDPARVTETVWCLAKTITVLNFPGGRKWPAKAVAIFVSIWSLRRTL